MEQVGPEHQHYLAHGLPQVGWDGDRNLVLYYNKLLGTMDVMFELPNAEPQIAVRMPIEGWDIHTICRRLALADGRKQSATEVLNRIETDNLRIEEADKRRFREQMEAAGEKLHWAARKDQGDHVAPMTVGSLPSGKVGS